MSAPMIEHRATFPLPVSAERAFRALVSPEDLARWFAEDVRVEPVVGGAFAFSGRGALASGTQTITALEAGRALAFEWAIHGVATQVRWTVRADGDASHLDIEHDVFGPLPFRDAPHAVGDLWLVHSSNLMAHLRGGSAELVDFTDERPAIRVAIEIAAPPAKVFRALLDPELMNRWLGGAAAVDVGRRAYSYGWKYDVEGRSVAGGPTKILELVENEKLVTDWPDWRGLPEKPDTRVTWLLEPLDGGARTRVTLVHDGFEHPLDRGDYAHGWGHFADELRKVVEA